MKRKAIILLTGAALLQIMPLVHLIFGTLSRYDLLSHGMASLLAAWVLSEIAMRPLRTTRWVEGCLIFCAVATFPIVGLGLALWLVRAVRELELPYVPAIAYVDGDPLATMADEGAVTSSIKDSIVRILSSPDPQARRTAVLSLRGIAEPEVVDLLERAVRDSDEYVRSYAQNHLQKLTTGLEKQVRDVQLRLETEPGNVQLRVALAELYYEWVSLNLAGPENATLFLGRALSSLEGIPIDTVEGWDAECLKVECFLRLGEWRQAGECLDALRQAGCHERAIREWQLEILYLGRRWEEFFGLLKTSMVDDPSPELRQMARFWMDPTLKEGIV